MNGADSVLVQNIIATASFINEDPFWNAQVAQIDINNCGADCWTMSMIPVVGNHKVDLGDGTDIASKFHRLYLFYDQVLKRTGFDKYQKIDVQYNGQVIGVKGHYSKVDSIQLRKNIESLLQQSRESNEMLEIAPSLNVVLPPMDSSGQSMEVYNVNDESEDSLLYLGNDKPEILKNKEPVVVAAPKKVETKTEVKKEVKPVVKATAKPAATKPAAKATKKAEPKKTVTSKKVETKKADNKTSTKKAETTKITSKKTSAGTAKKTEIKKTVTKKPEPKKEEVKRNLLAKPDPEKKTQSKGSDKRR